MSTTKTIYETLGWELSEKGSQLFGVCPFCGKEKMYVDPDKLVYHCKVCSKKGNSSSVVGEMFDNVYRPALKTFHIRQLAEARGMPEDMFDSPLLGYDPIGKHPVIVCRKPDGKAFGLRRVVKVKGKMRWLNYEGFGLFPMGLDEIGNHKKVYIDEGEWDWLACRRAIRMTKEDVVAIALPGASSFKKEWAEYFAGKDVICLYDNDKAGFEGAARAKKVLKPYTKSLQFLHWTENKGDGYDAHDLFKRRVSDPAIALKYISKNLKIEVPGSEPTAKTAIEAIAETAAHEQESVDPIPVEELHKTFHKWLHLQNCDLLDVTMGCLWTVFLPGSPLWMFIVAPPSGSKSETLMPASAWYRCHAISNVTSRGLISGYQLAGGEDPSLFATLNDRPSAIIIKDMTPVLTGNPVEREEIFGILRDAYDGSVQKVFGNGVRRVYEKLKFGVIAGVTPAVDAFDSVAMGERFLKFRADKELEREDDETKASRAIMNCGVETAMRDELKAACIASMVGKLPPENVAKPDAEFASTVSRLAGFCAKMRAVAPSDKFSDIQSMSPLREAPARLAVQFTKLAQGLSIHYGADNLNDEKVMRLVKRIAIHTPDIITMRVVQALYELRDVKTVNMLVLKSKLHNVSPPTISFVTTRLSRTKVIEIFEGADKMRAYRMTDSAVKVITDLQLFDNLPKNDPFYRGRRMVLKGKS